MVGLFYMWPIKKNSKIKKMPNQHHILDYAELDGGGGFFDFFFLRGRNPNRKFYKGENRKWTILQVRKTLLILN